MGILIAVVSDLHVNSTVGLSPPTMELDDGGTYTANRTQRFLWTAWGMFWREVEQLKQQTGYPVVSVFNGDIGELDAKARTHQVITRNKSTVLRMIRMVIERPIALSDRALFIRGTNSHVGKSGWLEEEVAQDCDISERNSEVSSWYAWRGWIGSLLLDLSHAVRLGGQPWTKVNPLGALALGVEVDCLRDRQPLPLVIRSHRHLFADTADNYPVRVVTIGAWQAVPEYIHALGGNVTRPDIGGIIITVEGDTWSLRKVRYPMKPARPQTLTLQMPNG